MKFAAGQHATSWLVDLPKAFAGFDNLEMHWITMSDQVDGEVSFEVHGAEFHVLPTTKDGRASFLYIQDRQRIQTCLQKIRPDVVHGWGTEDVYGWATVASGFPHLLSMQGIMSYYCLKNRMHPRDYFQALLELYCLRKAQIVTVESEWGAKVVRRRRGNRPIEIVEYGVRKSFYEAVWHPQERNPYAIFVGTLNPRKGIDDLVAAFGRMDVRYRLKVIGRGSAKYVRELQRRSTNNIEWLGEQSLQEVQKWMSEAWCLVLPTRADTSPNVVKEARVIGLPVLTTASGGQSAYLSDGENGFLIEPRNVDKTRERLLQILGDYQIAQSFGNAGRQRYRENFRPGTTAMEFMSIYHELVRKNPT